MRYLSLSCLLLFLLLLLVQSQARAAARVDIACVPGVPALALAQVRALPEAAWVPANGHAPFRRLGSGAWCRLGVQNDDGQPAVLRLRTGRYLTEAVAALHWPGAGDAVQPTVIGTLRGNFGGGLQPTALVERRHLDRPILLHLTGESVLQDADVQVWPLSEFVAQERRQHSFHVAVLTGMAILGAMATLFAFQLGRMVLMYLCVWMAAVLVLRLLETGLLAMSLDLDADARRWVQAISLMVAVAASTVFSDRYLGIHRHFPRIARGLWTAMAGMVLAALAFAWRYHEVTRMAGNVAVLAQFVLIVGCALVLARRGHPMARFFMMGWAPALMLSIVRTVYLLRDAMRPEWLEATWQLSLLFAVFVLLLATARAARYAEREMHIARRAATLDALTGLPNRAFLQTALEAGIDQARRSGAPLSLLFLDLDHFKAVNDRHGHDAGDACLRHFAAVMQASLRSGDILARLGGEEFVAVIPGSDLEQARHLADALRSALRQAPIAFDGVEVRMTMSVGVSTLRGDDCAERLLKRADRAVYDAKSGGRDRTCLEAAQA